jgi:hypothetical protein
VIALTPKNRLKIQKTGKVAKFISQIGLFPVRWEDWSAILPPGVWGFCLVARTSRSSIPQGLCRGFGRGALFDGEPYG